MSDELVTVKGKQAICTSLQIAENFDKEHKDVLEAIRNCIKKDTEMSEHFITNTHIVRGKQYPCFLMDEIGKEYLTNKFKYNVRSARFEYKFSNLLSEFFPNEVILMQYPILNYRVDFVLTFANIIVEYDEDHHEFQKERDNEREKEILKELDKMSVEGIPLYEGDSDEPNPWLKGINVWKCVRIKQGEEIQGLRNLFIEITNHSIRPCSDYMK